MNRRDSGMSLRLVLACVAGALVLVGIVGVILLRTTGLGVGGLGGAANRLEDWVGAQLLGVANGYLVPEVAYTDIDYQAPGTVTLDGVTFTAPDGTRVLELSTMTVILAEVPRVGEPIVIERLSFVEPNLRLIRETREDGSAGLKGLVPMIERSATSDDDLKPSYRLSNVLRLRAIEITNGAFTYEQGDGSPPMSVDGFTTVVTTSPDGDAPGWYDLDIQSGLGPFADLDLRGMLSLDSFEARIDTMRLSGELGDESIAALPPQLQQLVADHEIRGRLGLEASGVFPLTNPTGATLEATLRLEDCSLALSNYRLPVDLLVAEARLDSGIATLTDLTATLLGGTAKAFGDAQLAAPDRPARVSWTLTDLDLEPLLRTADEGALAGLLTGEGSVTASLSMPRVSLAGAGEVHVRNGRLLVLPGLTQLAELMNIATGGLAKGALSHAADAVFELNADGAVITESEVTTEVLGARATGTLGFDGTLDLAVNAGPMEKIQSLLGGLGDAIGSITDRLLKYRIRGTIENPEVSVEALGLGG